MTLNKRIYVTAVNSVPADGRAARKAATNERILSATRELIIDGVLEPTAREIAAEAGTTTRTLFRHFSDMDALYVTLIADARTKAAAVMDEPFGVDGISTWQEQLQRVIDRRVRIFESLLPLYVSSIWSRYRSVVDDPGSRKGVLRRRKRLLDILPGHIAAESSLFEALDGVLGIEYWISLRRDQRLSVTAARGALTVAVAKLTS